MPSSDERQSCLAIELLQPVGRDADHIPILVFISSGYH